MTEVRCHCCGIRLEGERAAIRRCILCDMCDRRHGDELQVHVTALVRNGVIDLWHGVTRMLVDDAHVAGLLAIVAVEDAGGLVSGWPTVLEFVPRWRVMIGRARARDELPDVTLVLNAVLARYLPAQNSHALRTAISIDMTDAMCLIDPSIVSVDVTCEQDALDAEYLMINVIANVPTLGQTAMAPDIQIPDSVMRGPRGQA
ncbi:MAG TPA: hypothetical protein VLN57_21055 [Xanthobacteraceae bacterium]|nr:hypothetical protein [Xanthobacteraceae bacterium]